MNTQREIKFRAWDGEKMHYWDSINHKATQLIHDTPFPKLHYLPMSWLMGDSNDWVWMQFTGLRDMNGREIYEGDIVKSSIGSQVVEIGWFTFNDGDGMNHRIYG